MSRLRAPMTWLLSLGLILSSVPARALQRAAVSPKTATAAAPKLSVVELPALPATALQKVSAVELSVPASAEAPTAAAQLQVAQPSEARPAEQAGAETFDGRVRRPDGSAGVLAAAGGVALPLGLKAPTLGVASYAAANALSVAFPMPQVYRTYREGHARGFPVVRASLGAFGTILLGMVNAPMLDKPFWGAMHIFVGLGMLAPFFIGKLLEKKGSGPRTWLAPEGKKGLAKLWARAKGDGAFARTLLAAAPLLAASAALYAAAAAVVPGLMAQLTPAASDNVLLGLQLFKAALFMAVFAPDIVALIKGKEPKGFTMAFNLVFFASVASFTAWGFTAAAAEEAGPIRDQYLVLALRNLGESVASALSIAAILRARRLKK